MPRLALTGAGGFVGRHVISAAAAEGWDVAGIVRSAEAARTVTYAGGVPVMVPALTAEALAPAFAGAAAVVHLAQIGSETKGQTFDAVNVEGTRAVAAAARAAGVPRVVYFSGLGVAHYGMAPRTTNRYFLSKLRAEAALFESGLEALVFRPSYIVGPRDGLVTSLLKQMAEGEVEQVGDGAYRMQPIAVRDAAAAVVAGAAGPTPAPAPGRGPHRVFDLVGPAGRDLPGVRGRSRHGRARAPASRGVPRPHHPGRGSGPPGAGRKGNASRRSSTACSATRWGMRGRWKRSSAASSRPSTKR